MDLYGEEILDHYRNPRNFGDLEGANLRGEEINTLCGDHLVLQLKVEEGKAVEARFRGEGCAVSQASASIFTEYLKGKKLTTLVSLGAGDVLENLGLPGLSPARLRCALLPLEALRKALTMGGRL